jgi:uncharacterized protein (DUF924 family)
VDRIDTILDYWFGGGPDRDKWYGGGPELDAHIRDSFGDDVRAACAGDLDAWADTARGRIALIILLDQFTRNMFRGSPECYAADSKAQQLTLEGIANGHAAELPELQHAFLLMPLMHSEDIALQNRCVECFDALAAACDASPHKKYVEGSADYARKHRDTVAKFGRFPHRNELLGRETTPEEAAFLEKGWFGG